MRFEPLNVHYGIRNSGEEPFPGPFMTPSAAGEVFRLAPRGGGAGRGAGHGDALAARAGGRGAARGAIVGQDDGAADGGAGHVRGHRPGASHHVATKTGGTRAHALAPERSGQRHTTTTTITTMITRPRLLVH